MKTIVRIMCAAGHVCRAYFNGERVDIMVKVWALFGTIAWAWAYYYTHVD